eukprot:jgi/Chlat1/6817/Chrsp51S09103
MTPLRGCAYAAVAVCLLVAAGTAQASILAPAFLISNRGYFGEGSRVVYQTIESGTLAEGVIGSLILQQQKGDAQWAAPYIHKQFVSQEPPAVVVVYIGSQIRSHDLAQYGPDSTLQPLKDALSSAESSLTLAYVSLGPSYGQIAADMFDAFTFRPNEQTAGKVYAAGNCREVPESVTHLSTDATIDEFLRHRQQRPVDSPADLLLVCSDAAVNPDYNEYPVVASVLSSEVSRFQRLVDHLHSANVPYALVYTSDVTAPDSDGQPFRRRLLQEVTNNTCDEKCMTRVATLEGLGAILLIILLSGLCCLGMLDVPMRFDKTE